MDDYLIVDERTLLAQCDIDHYRSSGPGGQKRNKTSSAVRLRHRPTGLIVTATEERSQHVNKTRALRRLRKAIALNVRRDIDVATYRKSAALSSCVTGDGVLQVGRRDERYCPAVSEILDVLAAQETRVRDTALSLGVSTANLVGFFQRDSKLWACVNQMRAGERLGQLRQRS